jgi:hypothetical protein
MRRLADDTAAFFNAVAIIVNVEAQLEITITDDAVLEIHDWIELTLHDLVEAVRRSAPSVPANLAEEAIRLAVLKEFPDAPQPLNFTVLLLDALSSPRKYGGY